MPTPQEIQKASDRANLKATLSSFKAPIAAAQDVLSLPGRALGGVVNTALRLPRALGLDIPFIPEGFFGGDSSSLTPYFDRLREPVTPAAPVAVAAPAVAAAAPVAAPVAAVAAVKPLGQNYLLNNRTGARYEFDSQPQVASAVPSAAVGLPRLAGARESTGYQPTTLAGALVQNQETKRQSGLQTQDIQNALTAYDTAGRQQAAQGAAAEQRLNRESAASTARAKLAEDKRQFDATQALPKFEYRTKYDPATGLAVGTEVFNAGQPVAQPAAGVTVGGAKAAVKAGAPKAEVNKRLVAADLAPLP